MLLIYLRLFTTVTYIDNVCTFYCGNTNTKLFSTILDSSYSTVEECSGNIGATVDVIDSPNQPAPETLLETLNNFKPTPMQALEGNTLI